MSAPLAPPGPVSDVRAPDCRARWPADKFLEMVAIGAVDGMKVALLEGELERMTPPMSEHGRMYLEVALALKTPLGESMPRIYGGIGIRFGEAVAVPGTDRTISLA